MVARRTHDRLRATWESREAGDLPRATKRTGGAEADAGLLAVVVARQQAPRVRPRRQRLRDPRRRPRPPAHPRGPRQSRRTLVARRPQAPLHVGEVLEQRHPLRRRRLDRRRRRNTPEAHPPAADVHRHPGGPVPEAVARRERLAIKRPTADTRTVGRRTVAPEYRSRRVACVSGGGGAPGGAGGEGGGGGGGPA